MARGLDAFGRLRIVGEQYLELCEDVFPVLDRMELSQGWARREGTRRCGPRRESRAVKISAVDE